jgi:hypothetical protein
MESQVVTGSADSGMLDAEEISDSGESAVHENNPSSSILGYGILSTEVNVNEIVASLGESEVDVDRLGVIDLGTGEVIVGSIEVHGELKIVTHSGMRIDTEVEISSLIGAELWDSGVVSNNHVLHVGHLVDVEEVSHRGGGIVIGTLNSDGVGAWSQIVNLEEVEVRDLSIDLEVGAVDSDNGFADRDDVGSHTVIDVSVLKLHVEVVDGEASIGAIVVGILDYDLVDVSFHGGHSDVLGMA